VLKQGGEKVRKKHIHRLDICTTQKGREGEKKEKKEGGLRLSFSFVYVN
jgi:hypothetical protein